MAIHHWSILLSTFVILHTYTVACLNNYQDDDAFWEDGAVPCGRDHIDAMESDNKLTIPVDHMGVVTPQNRSTCQSGAPPAPPERTNTTERLKQLRLKMANKSVTGGKPIDAYLITNHDQHQGTGGKFARRMQYISGFTGSSGLVIVTREGKAALWTDSRYWTQADRQLDCNWALMKDGSPGVPTAAEWVLSQVKKGSRVGGDARMLSIDFWNRWQTTLEMNNITLVSTENNLVDLVWENRPPVPNEPLIEHKIEFTGKSWQKKIDEVRKELKAEKANVLVLTRLDQTAYLFNLRGSDYSFSPMFYTYSIIEDHRVRLYIRNVSKLLTPNIRKHLNTNMDGSCKGKPDICVHVVEYDAVFNDLRSLTNQNNISRIWVSPAASYAVYDACGKEKKAFLSVTPIKHMKAVKNDVERRRYRECQIRDSAAVVEFAAFMEKEIQNGKKWNELTAGYKVTELRAKQAHFHGLSFPPISSSGPNAAMAHYMPTNITARALTKQEPYLLDSGGQYFDGTTDITRTFHFGTPDKKFIEAYTRVLMGHIDLASLTWPKGMTASSLDLLARSPLWTVGWGYGHGTGHGIGYFLNVHESPAYMGSSSVLKEGMFSSDEPGYYEEGKFGIRLETIVGVVRANTTYNFRNREWLKFEAVTLVPFEPKLIDYNLLTYKQIRWLNLYNKGCLEKVGPYLKSLPGTQQAHAWLVERTKPIPENKECRTGSAVVASYSLPLFFILVIGYVTSCFN